AVWALVVPEEGLRAIFLRLDAEHQTDRTTGRLLCFNHVGQQHGCCRSRDEHRWQQTTLAYVHYTPPNVPFDQKETSIPPAGTAVGCTPWLVSGMMTLANATTFLVMPNLKPTARSTTSIRGSVVMTSVPPGTRCNSMPCSSAGLAIPN